MKNFVIVACLALHGIAAMAAPTGAHARYQQERQRCMDAPEAQESKDCLREAAAAFAEARAGRLMLSEQARDFEANARRRCERLPADHRSACEARMRGEGTTSGSVEGGGIYRELIIREPSEASR